MPLTGWKDSYIFQLQRSVPIPLAEAINSIFQVIASENVEGDSIDFEKGYRATVDLENRSLRFGVCSQKLKEPGFLENLYDHYLFSLLLDVDDLIEGGDEHHRKPCERNFALKTLPRGL